MITCASCGNAIPEGSRFCGMCGAALTASATPPREERKVVTIVFTDLVGSTARAEGLDPEDVRATLSAYYTKLRAELERFGGTVEKFIGDAVMAVFGAPVAHEDDPERAVRAALAIRDAIAGDLEIRTAVNTGEALVALGARTNDGEGMVSGDVVNTAARLQNAAPVNGILVGEATYRATRHVIEYRDANAVEAKGKSEPVPVWEAVDARSHHGTDVDERFRTPLVGRERERTLLADALARARVEQSVQLVTLVGVPGIGKTRLVAELLKLVDEDEEFIGWRQGRSLPYGERVSFWALGEIVKAQAGILESDDAAAAEEKLVAMVELLVEDEKEREWLARHTRPLLGLEGAERTEREEAFAAWRRLLEATAEQRDLVLVFEDLHWADEGLLDFVDYLADWATTVPMLIVATARPELLDRRPGWGGGKRSAFTLSIGALSDEDTAVLLQRLLDRSVIDADAQQAVLERAEGNPLYAEEYARMLGEHEGGDLALPETVQGLIAARIDGLAPEEKALLQEASVIGKVFWPGALPDGDDRILHSLERKEFTRRERRSSMAGETQYAFLHALVREVAYGQIPRAKRAKQHRRAGEWLASLTGDRTEDHAEMLAHHYREALTLSRAAGLDTTELREPARQAFVEGARRALSLNAGGVSYELALEAIELTEPDDPKRPALQLLAGSAAADLAEIDATALFEEARDGFLALGDVPQAAEASRCIGREAMLRGDTGRALEASQRALELARSEPLTAVSVWALAGRARQLEILEGAHDEAIALAQEVLAFADDSGDGRLAMSALGTIGIARINSGDTTGVAALEEGLARGQGAGVAAYETGTMLNNLANCLWKVGRIDDATARYAEAREHDGRYGVTVGLAWLDGELVFDCDRHGDLDGTVAAATHFLDLPNATTNYQTRPVLATRARALVARGEVDEAVADAEQALSGFREETDAQTALEILTVAARCYSAAGRTDDANALIEELLSAPYQSLYDLPLYLLELDRGHDFLAITEGNESFAWEQAGRAAAGGDPLHAAEIYGSIGARFPEAWAGLLAAERGDTSRLESALAYFEAQRATPYIQRCRALMQASA